MVNCYEKFFESVAQASRLCMVRVQTVIDGGQCPPYKSFHALRVGRKAHEELFSGLIPPFYSRGTRR